MSTTTPATTFETRTSAGPPRSGRWARSLVGWSAAGAIAVGFVAGVVRYRATHQAPPFHYETLQVDRGPVRARVTATGSVSALVTVSVGSQVSGRIETIAADFGSPVHSGQVVATIDPAFFEAAVAQARANLAAARANHQQALATQYKARRDRDRSATLLHQALVSQADFDAAEATAAVADASVGSAASAIAQAQAVLGQAELNLGYCTIRSPIDGVVISRNIDVGQTVAASFQAPTLFTIAQDLTRMQVDTNVAEADVGKVRAGMPVTFTVDAYPDREFPGNVRQVRDNAQTIQNVVTYDAVIDVENDDLALKPAMTANVTFVYAIRASALRVPNGGLRFKPDAATVRAMTEGDPEALQKIGHGAKSTERIVWVLRQGHATPALLSLGITDGERTEVLGGDVREGDEVVTEATSGAGGSTKSGG